MEDTHSGGVVRPVLDVFKSKSTSRMKNLQLNIPQSSSTCLTSIFGDMTEMSMGRSSLLHRELYSPSFTTSTMTRRKAETKFKLIRTRLHPYFAVYTCCIPCQPHAYRSLLGTSRNDHPRRTPNHPPTCSHHQLPTRRCPLSPSSARCCPGPSPSRHLQTPTHHNLARRRRVSPLPTCSTPSITGCDSPC